MYFFSAVSHLLFLSVYALISICLPQSVLSKQHPPGGAAGWGTSCTCSGAGLSLIAPLTEAKQEQSWGLAGGGKGERERTPQKTSEKAEPSI